MKVFGVVGRNGSGKDYAAFRRQDQREEALFHLSRTFAQADLTLSNDGTLAAFRREIDRSLAKLLP